jgi:hypothetical protein
MPTLSKAICIFNAIPNQNSIDILHRDRKKINLKIHIRNTKDLE